jgi:hypothetical protein
MFFTFSPGFIYFHQAVFKTCDLQLRVTFSQLDSTTNLRSFAFGEITLLSLLRGQILSKGEHLF